MRKRLFARILHLMLLISIVSGSVIFPCLSSGRRVLADSDMVIMISTNDYTVNPGDIVTINVYANEFENITRFGPIDLRFPADKAEFVSLRQPTELSSFVYSYDTDNAGHLIVSAVDEVVEEDLAEAQISDDSYDPSVYYDDDLVLFSASFRMTADSVGSSRFWLETADGFRDSSGEEFSASIGDGLTVEVEDAVSSDASLMRLEIDGVALTPDFDPDIHEYTTSVNTQVTSVEVSVATSNLGATATVEGNSHLQLGDNIITIIVTAQDGVTQSEYTIYISRQESFFAEGAVLMDSDDKSYTFVTMPAFYDVPEGFVSSSRTINGYTVPVYVKEGVTSYLVYLYDGEGEPCFFFYNPTTKVVTRFNNNNYAIISSRVLNVVQVPEAVKIPSGFKPATITTADDVVLEGYINDDGVFIAYMKDENGNCSFYRYDPATNAFIDYMTVDRTAERIYGIFFRVFLIISLIESVIIIATVYLIRRIISNRNNPRPRRV